MKRYLVNPFLTIVSGLTTLFSLIMVGCLLYLGRTISIVVFAVIALLFFYMTMQNGAMITIDATGVTRSIVGRRRQSLTWQEIGEVGIAGTKVFRQKDSKKTGSLYIYLSPEALDEDGRFEMMLEWPPKDKLYLTYSPERIKDIQRHWSSKIKTYHAEGTHF